MWFISDLHFYHRNVIKYDNRPFKDLTEMHEELIKRWNKKVKKGDTVFVLGDFIFRGPKQGKEIVDQLNGRKIFVKGNHDPSARKLLAMGFDDVLENEAIKLPNGMYVYVSHFPYYGFEDQRYQHKRIHDDGQSILLHGHVHTAWKVNGRQINVGCMHYDYAPVHVNEIIKMIDKVLENKNEAQSIADNP
jgi:calcineurin-like phosphoesterase family protein